MQNKIEVFIFKFNLSENSAPASQKYAESTEITNSTRHKCLSMFYQDRIIIDIFLKRLYIGFLRFKIYLKMKILIQRSCCVRNNRLIDWWTGDCFWNAQDRTAVFFPPKSSSLLCLSNLVYFVHQTKFLFAIPYSFVSPWFKT